VTLCDRCHARVHQDGHFRRFFSDSPGLGYPIAGKP
jgi:hypothetical protein